MKNKHEKILARTGETGVEALSSRTATTVESHSQDAERRVVPIEEAIRRIGNEKYIHTFMNSAFAIIGADHDRTDLIAMMRKHGVEDAGEGASGMGHTLVIVNYPLDGTRVTPLFIEAAKAEQP